MANEFPNFSLGFIQEFEEYFLYDLDNEEKTHSLAAVGLEAVNVADEVGKVTVEKADKRTEVNEHRFVNQPQELQHSPVKLSVKSLYPVKCFKWKTSAVSYYKLTKSSRWSSLLTKCPVFQIPAEAMNSLFSICHVGNVQVFVSNNLAGFL